MPAEYLRLRLCRDIFRCTPSELRAQDPIDILQVLTCLAIEAEVNSQ